LFSKGAPPFSAVSITDFAQKVKTSPEIKNPVGYFPNEKPGFHGFSRRKPTKMGLQK
jgi:hypothetical protein